MRFLSSLLLLRCPSLNPSISSSLLPLRLPIHLRYAIPPPDLSLHRSPLRSPSIRAFPASFCSNSSSSGEGDMAVAAGEGSPASRFWSKSKKETAFAAYSPFIVCLAAGKLEMEVFRRFITQDVYFLKAFAHAYEVAEDCADDDDAKTATGHLRKAILRRLKACNSTFEEWGVDLTKEITPNPVTVKFTDFLQATAAGKVDGGKVPSKIATPFEKTKIAAYTVGAMTPCMRLYSFLVKELHTLVKPDESNHPYKKWIDTYSSIAFEATTLEIEELLDKLSVSLTGEELEVIEKLYNQSMKLEIEFYCAQPIVQPTVVPLARLHNPVDHRLVIFSDFDLTCTTVDSSAILAEMAILTAPKPGQTDPDHPNDRMSSTDLRNSWGVLSGQYTEEYESCIEKILVAEQAEGFNYEGLCKALELLSDFEKRANSRVIESGVLKGVNLDDIKRAGEHATFQDGCLNFLQKIVKKKEELNADLHVLSYCWCGDLIRTAFSTGGLGVVSVHSNEFNYEGSISTGQIVRKMESPLNKVQAFKSILKDSSDGGKHFSVYIGDSVGDLLCLLKADVGIVVGSSVSLRTVGAHFGVSFVPLFHGLVQKQRQLSDDGMHVWKGLSGILYTVSSWAEIHAFILGA